VGIEWASESHQVCLLDASGQCLGERAVRHGGAGLVEACNWLAAKTAAAPASIAVAIEVPLDRFRDHLSIVGAKDDRRDAQVLADALRTDRQALRRLSLDDPLVIELREWSRMTEDLQQERTRLTNRLREQLWRYYPQMLELGGDLAAAWVLELWRQAPTPVKAARLPKRTVERLLRAHRIRRLDAAAVLRILRILRQKPLAVAPGTVAAATAHIRLAVERLELVKRQIKASRRHLEAPCDRLAAGEESVPGQTAEQRDVTILRSMPGTGRIVIATLLAEASLGRAPCCRTASIWPGIAPIGRKVGPI
jgi:transposase